MIHRLDFHTEVGYQKRQGNCVNLEHYGNAILFHRP